MLVKTQFDRVRERRTNAEGEALLTEALLIEALARLHARRDRGTRPSQPPERRGPHAAAPVVALGDGGRPGVITQSRTAQQ